MSDTDSRRPGGQPQNRNAAKPDGEKITGKGRIVADFGELKGRIKHASNKRGMKIVDWLREAAEEKLERDNPQNLRQID